VTAGCRDVDVEGPDLHGRVALVGEQDLGKVAGVAGEGDLIVIRPLRTSAFPISRR